MKKFVSPHKAQDTCQPGRQAESKPGIDINQTVGARLPERVMCRVCFLHLSAPADSGIWTRFLEFRQVGRACLGFAWPVVLTFHEIKATTRCSKPTSLGVDCCWQSLSMCAQHSLSVIVSWEPMRDAQRLERNALCVS